METPPKKPRPGRKKHGSGARHCFIHIHSYNNTLKKESLNFNTSVLRYPEVEWGVAGRVCLCVTHPHNNTSTSLLLFPCYKRGHCGAERLNWAKMTERVGGRVARFVFFLRIPGVLWESLMLDLLTPKLTLQQTNDKNLFHWTSLDHAQRL